MISLLEKPFRSAFYFLLATAVLLPGAVGAGEETLECKLYIASSMDDGNLSKISMEHAGVLNSVRRSSFCMFPDGRVADKQFVMVSRTPGDGSSGSNLGYSVYTMENGDSISAQFEGSWDSNGFKGTYNILGGTGSYEGATGDGTITGMKSPWKESGLVGIRLNVKTP